MITEANGHPWWHLVLNMRLWALTAASRTCVHRHKECEATLYADSSVECWRQKALTLNTDSLLSRAAYVSVCVGMCIVRVCARPNVMCATRDGPDPAIWWLSLSCASMQYRQYFNRAQVWRLNGYGCCDSRRRAAFSGLLYFRTRLPRMRSSHIRVRREWLLNHYFNQFFPSEGLVRKVVSSMATVGVWICAFLLWASVQSAK